VIDASRATEKLTPLIKAQALGLGFDLVGVTRTGPATSAEQYDRWIADGRAGTMAYMERNADIRHDPRRPFEGAVSAVVVALDYGGRQRSGPVARYARGDDYHDVMRAKLDLLHEWIDARLGAPVRGRSYVDTGPILERDLARRAGLGWFGKNTNLINPDRGSFFFIGALFLGIELDEDAPFEADRCGTCTRCLEACPTGAIVAPRALDATRCISYLTIELRGAIPVDLREPIGSLIYGCDICQDVCPFNVKFSEELKVPEFAARPPVTGDAKAIARGLLELEHESYVEAFRGSPMKRAKLRGLQRNAAVALGNVGDESDITLLKVAGETDALVREHAEWAVERITSRTACGD
jgi:epoxyqueuosine reductase